MHAIQEWINNHLIEWGIISSSANELDNTIVLLLIIAVTVGIDYACRYIFLNMFKRLAKRTRNQWDDLIVERKIINKLMHMIPAILVYVLLPLAFPVDETPKILGILQMICKIYIIAVSLRFISASLNVVHKEPDFCVFLRVFCCYTANKQTAPAEVRQLKPFPAM